MENKPRSEDRRVRRTKKLLAQALTSLMGQKQLKDITVKELTEKADMNRGTFYLYYRDIFQMLESIEDELLSSLNLILDEKLGETPPNERMLIELFEFIRMNQQIMDVLLSSRGDICFLHKLNRLIREKCISIWGITSEREGEFDYNYYFVAFGCMGLVKAWINKGCVDSSERLAKRVNGILEGQLIKRTAT
ncbi:MAG: TetR/AcrR family transcriptional regulator [Clostridiales bacterium]|nr:TetR/AcrR family transcriptional regulator [Clostridiales bacterium]